MYSLYSIITISIIMLNYYTIPTKSMELPIHIRTTTGPPIPRVSASFFTNIPNIIAQFNIPNIAKQYNISNNEMNRLIKINESYGFLPEIVSPKFISDHSKVCKITNAFFTRVEVLSVSNLLESIRNGSTNNNIMYIGDDFKTFPEVITYMIPKRTVIHEHITSSQLEKPGGIEEILSQKTKKNTALIYIDVCAPEIVYSHTYTIFLLKSIALILSLQSKGGTAIIKTNMIVFKPILDILYLLSGKYEHIHIIRPFVSENDDSRFVILTGLLTPTNIDVVYNLINITNNINTGAPNQIIMSVTDYKISQYFISKIEECNLLIGQKYVEKHDSLVTLIKNYNHDFRDDYSKNVALTRCINWCEKHNIPTKYIENKECIENVGS